MKQFELSKEQEEKFEQWRKSKGEVYVGAIGGAYTFCFTPTGLGVLVRVDCSDGTSLELTDFSDW